ncbi:hybrid sensor histidine kinase/response regulator [Burkholderia ubonensis]|uniref:hybrid sensor histidine kinase/response regulator n=1 Tax=Burkholderia ubonensis TaxID=101571 RepID=UPI00075E9B72|nr:hybrid sensor histidine kinase/response regulator [Burkholderia ubonensis]KWD51278.1 hybrid sensor histidine kinase/response regulator [Burkholderia ubonensis]KWD57074.1 hybrid sensor histidine kinase/response regulator [Burkholderia ubonensis]
MPEKLKRLVAHAAAAGRKPFDPERVRRQQQSLLYGGGAAITVFIVLCAALVVRLEVLDYFTQVRAAFLKREAELHAELHSTKLLLGQYVNQSQALWRADTQASPEVMQEFAAGQGKIVRFRFGRAAAVGLANLSPENPARLYSPYLALIVRQFDAIATQVPVDVGLSGYLISLYGDLLGVFDPILVDRALALPAGHSLEILIGELLPSSARIVAQTPGMTGQDGIVLESRVDPLLGRRVLRFVRLVYDADGKPVAWAVINGRARIDDMFASRAIDETYALIGSGGNVLAGAQPDGKLIAKALDQAREPSGEHVTAHRVGARFVVSDRMPESDLVLMGTFSWRSIVAAIAVPAATTVGAALVAIVLLWCAIVLFDHRALRPANRRAIRLIESEALNRTLIRTAPAGIMLLSLANGDTMARNDAAQAYGDTRVAPSLGKRIWQAYRDGIAAGRAPRVLTHELSVELAGGTTYLAAHIVRTRYRGVDVLLCTLTDITAGKQVEHKLREAREAADDANKAKSTFLATMSHEIRTPLNAIVGNLELMERAQLPADQRRRLQTVMSSSDALLRMINDVLDLSKAESNQMALEAIAFDLRAVLRDVAAIFRPLADAKRLTLECRIAPELADGYVGDPTRVRQLVSNLVSNAIKFTEHGGVTIEAGPGARAGETRCIEIAVRDTGIGIPAESLPTLFDVYIQTDPSIYRRFGGTGLGLPLCRRIARLMQGELAVESRPGEGTTFTATLPLADALPGWRAAFDEQGNTAATGVERPRDDAAAPLRVLVAEDHPASRALLRDQLDALHWNATLVTNGIEAMRAFFTQPFDVVLTDLGMPELDGFALANFLREQGAKVPVIAMTAHATEEDRRRCAQVGVAEVVLKPLSISALDAVLRRHTALDRADAGASGGADAGTGTASGAPADADASGDARPAISDEIRETLRNATLHSLTVIGDALSSGDIDRVKVELHSMRGGFALAGDVDASDACAQAERVVAEGGIDAMKAAWPALEAAIGEALERLSGAGPYESQGTV